MTHMGDLIVGGLLGAAGRFGIGSVGTILAVAQNTPAVPTPGFGPICSATGSGGLLVNGTLYDFTYAWQTPNASPDGGITASGPITVFTATSTGVVSVQCAAAPTSGLTLVVYGALHGGTLTQQTTLFPTSTITTNTVTISNIVLGALTSGSNTSGGLGFVWSPASITGPTGATGTPGPAGVSSTTVSGASPYFCAQEQQPSGTSGGTFTAGSWQVRTVNTILANDPAIAAKLSANTITLPSGTFRTVISTPAYRVNRHAARLQNTSANTVALPGSSEEAFDTGTGGSTTRSIIHGRFSLAVTSTLQIQHQCETTSATDGFGRNTGSAFAVAQEVYTVAEFWLEGGTIPFFGTTFQNPSLGNISTQRYIGIIAQAIPIARSLTAKPFLLPTFENPSLDLLAARRQDATTSITSSINNNNILPV
jgi:hypothetical protein